MKIIIDTLDINHVWQYVIYSNETRGYIKKADDILSYMLKKEDNSKNNVEKVFNDLELKYLRLFEKDRSDSYSGAIKAIQELRRTLGLLSTTDQKVNPVADEEEYKEVCKQWGILRCTIDTPTSKTDPRCDGCKYQHPYLQNMDIDELNKRVLCRRNINPPFYKDGIQMFLEPGSGLMICSVYKWDNGLVKVGPQDDGYVPQYKGVYWTWPEGKLIDVDLPTTDTERIAKFTDPKPGDAGNYANVYKALTELVNKEAIIEIIDILSSYAVSHSIHRDENMASRLIDLNAKLLGDK
jgi:hypothetical protein